MKAKKVFITLTIDPTFCKFLDYMKEENGMVRGRTISIAITREYKEKYKAFLEKYENGAEKS